MDIGQGAVHAPKVCRNKSPVWNRAPWNSNQSVAMLILLLSDLTSSYIFDKNATENEKQSVTGSYFATKFQFGQRHVPTSTHVKYKLTCANSHTLSNKKANKLCSKL